MDIQNAVYRRTVLGQRELVIPSGVVAEDDLRLLSMMTGFTALDALLSILPPLAAPECIVARLLEQGLAEPVANPAG